MIPYSRDPRQSIPTSAVKIIGLGGAGTNMLERVALDGMEGAGLLALNTDSRTLGACMAGEKIQLGVNLTRGLGTGGDPELGRQAVLEAEESVRGALQGRRIVFVCVGLGGGTGSGAAPIVTRIAREEGAFVVVFATMPFAFEGRRRREQAEASLNELAVLSNALVTFDNNRMGELVLAKQGIHEAFVAADHMICESMKAVIRLVVRPGLINVGLDELMSALRTNRSRCLFGSGMANGKDRATKALRNALASPLLDQGALLKDAQTVLVHVCGGEDLTLFEIELLMQRLQKYIPEQAHVLFGAAVDPSLGDALSLTLISALPEDALASATSEALSRETRDMPLLNPSQGFTPPPPAASIQAPQPQPQSQPQPQPQPDIQPQPQPEIQPQPQPEIQPQPEPEIQPQPESEPTAQPEARVVSSPMMPTPEPVPVDEFPAARAAAESESLFTKLRRTLTGGPAAESGAAGLLFDEMPPGPEPAAGPASAAAADRPRPVAIAEFVALTPPGDAPAPSAEPATTPAAERSPLPPKRPPGATPWSSSQGPRSLEPELPPFEPPAAATPDTEAPKLKLGVKSSASQSELSLDSAPRGRFEGEIPNVVDGEDLDLPPFMRKKRG